MKRSDILDKAKKRKKELGLTIDNISRLSNLGHKAVASFFVGDDVGLSTLEKISDILGIDFAGNEIVDIQTLKEHRAKQKALEIVSLVQDTSSLEMQGLEEKQIQLLVNETKEEFLTGQYSKYLWVN